MSRVIDPKSADGEINYVSRVSTSPVVTPPRLGPLLGRESREVIVQRNLGVLVGVSS